MTERTDDTVPIRNVSDPGDPAPQGAVPDPVTTELAGLRELPVEEHVAVFDRVHRQLRDRLADAPGTADERPAT